FRKRFGWLAWRRVIRKTNCKWFITVCRTALQCGHPGRLLSSVRVFSAQSPSEKDSNCYLRSCPNCRTGLPDRGNFTWREKRRRTRAVIWSNKSVSASATSPGGPKFIGTGGYQSHCSSYALSTCWLSPPPNSTLFPRCYLRPDRWEYLSLPQIQEGFRRSSWRGRPDCYLILVIRARLRASWADLWKNLKFSTRCLSGPSGKRITSSVSGKWLRNTGKFTLLCRTDG